jgi:SulP family sulfate permease
MSFFAEELDSPDGEASVAEGVKLPLLSNLLQNLSAARIESLFRDISGGFVGALIAIPIILSCGVVSYQNIGPAYVAAGISAAFVAAVITSVLAGLFGGAPLHINSPKTSHAAILSGLVASVAASHSFTSSFSGAGAAGALMAVVFITLAISGITQAILGVSRMGSLVKFIPYPVLAGFINGFALQIILNQVPKTLGLDREKEILAVFTGAAHVNLWPLAFAVVSGFLMVTMKKRSKLVPPALIALAGGTLIQMLAAKLLPSENLGPIIGTLPSGISFELRLSEMIPFATSHTFALDFFPILITGVTLAFVSSIQSLLSISATEGLFGTRHNSNRELTIQGLGNLLSALFGGTPSGGSPNMTQAVYSAGGRTGFANLAYAGTLLAMSYGLSRVIGFIPLSVMASVVIVTTATAMDKWTHKLLISIGSSSSPASRRDVAMNLAVVMAVTYLVLFASALVALGVGLAGVFAAFLYRSNARIMRRVLYGTHFHSRTERPHASLEALEEHGHQIVVVELDGPIFFGSAETVARFTEGVLPKVKWLILDLKRVSHLDSSGTIMLKRLDEQARKDGKRLLLAHLPEGGNRRRFIRDMGFTQPEKDGRFFDNTDAALTRAEDELLTEVSCISEVQEVPFRDFEAVKGLSDTEVQQLEGFLIRKVYAAGDVIVRRHEFCRSLLFLAQGRLSVQSESNQTKVRIASYRPGMTIGEMTLFSESGSSADVVTDTPVVVFELPPEALKTLERDFPGLEVRLMRNLAVELSYRLRALFDVVVEIEEA